MVHRQEAVEPTVAWVVETEEELLGTGVLSGHQEGGASSEPRPPHTSIPAQVRGLLVGQEGLTR